MKRIFAILMCALLLLLALGMVGCDEDTETPTTNSTTTASSNEEEYGDDFGMDFDNLFNEDGSINMDFGEIFGSGVTLPDDEFE